MWQQLVMAPWEGHPAGRGAVADGEWRSRHPAVVGVGDSPGGMMAVCSTPKAGERGHGMVDLTANPSDMPG